MSKRNRRFDARGLLLAGAVACLLPLSLPLSAQSIDVSAAASSLHVASPDAAVLDFRIRCADGARFHGRSAAASLRIEAVELRYPDGDRPGASEVVRCTWEARSIPAETVDMLTRRAAGVDRASAAALISTASGDVWREGGSFWQPPAESTDAEGESP